MFIAYLVAQKLYRMRFGKIVRKLSFDGFAESLALLDLDNMPVSQ